MIKLLVLLIALGVGVALAFAAQGEAVQLDAIPARVLPVDWAGVSRHESDVARFQAEDARTGVTTDEVAATVVMRPTH